MLEEFIHPRDLIANLMTRIYRYGMTTMSGGNLSLRDGEGNMWITPAGVDKGGLSRDDIVKIEAVGNVKSIHRPSSELPFHQAIYEARPNIGGIVHAHPSALVSYSMIREVPPVRIIPQAYEVCGRVGIAAYALPGSKKLGERIAAAFADGYDAVLLENHGIVCAGATLLEAFHRFETLEFCARLAIRARQLGGVTELTDEQIDVFQNARTDLPEFNVTNRTNEEKALRRHIVELTHRAYDHQLMTSTEGVVSARLDETSFVITPTRKDRRLLDVADVVLIRDGQRERGKQPSRSVLMHQAIYQRHPDISAIISGQAPHVTAFAVSGAPFETRTIPESYILLRGVQTLPYGPQFVEPSQIADAISPAHPVVLLRNDAILVTGTTLLQAFDRFEVSEFTARSLVDANQLGSMVPIGADETRELEQAFGLPASTPAGNAP